MTDIKLFSLQDGLAQEVPGRAVVVEKSLQTLIERNLQPMLGIRCPAGEYSTGPKHGGRIDTLAMSPGLVTSARAIWRSRLRTVMTSNGPSRCFSRVMRRADG